MVMALEMALASSESYDVVLAPVSVMMGTYNVRDLAPAKKRGGPNRKFEWK